MIPLRPAETDADLERCVEIFNAVDPAHPIALADVRSSRGKFLLADGGYVYVADSSLQNWQYTMVRVRPEARRRGVGTALLDAAFDEACRGSRAGMAGRVDGGSRARATAQGFAETRQDVELRRQVRPGDGEIAHDIVPLAAENGYRELVTFTDTTNAPMRRVSGNLGYVETLGPIVVERRL